MLAFLHITLEVMSLASSVEAQQNQSCILKGNASSNRIDLDNAQPTNENEMDRFTSFE
jgi:hypothetical protein